MVFIRQFSEKGRENEMPLIGPFAYEGMKKAVIIAARIANFTAYVSLAAWIYTTFALAIGAAAYGCLVAVDFVIAYVYDIHILDYHHSWF